MRKLVVVVMVAAYVVLGIIDIRAEQWKTGAASLLLAAVQTILFL
jgi:hypothetical protein